MKTRMAWVLTAVLAAVTAGAEEPAQALARGKLEADLGHHAVAAEAFASVAQAPQATAPQRWEALVRLGVARRDTGDAKGSADAFEEASRTYGKDPEALRFLVQAVGSALPGQERWDEVWSQVTLDVDRRVPERPQVRVTWPGLPFGLCPCSGAPIDPDFGDADLQDVFRLFADISGLNVVVHPGTMGRVTFRARQVPWDEALERVLAPNGFAARIDGNVVEIGPPRKLGDKRSFSGAAISFDFVSKDLVETLREIAAHGRASVEVPEGVTGRVTIKLDEVPWDQAFDLLVRVNGLTWTRTGDVIRVEPPRLRKIEEIEPKGARPR
jgi:hypothetical protein